VDNFDLPLMAFGGKLGRLHDFGSNQFVQSSNSYLHVRNDFGRFGGVFLVAPF
jgi:hypothetical protein